MRAEYESLPVVRSGVAERDYLLARADAHRLLAERSDEPGARSIHRQLRHLYRARAAAVVMVVPD